MEKKELTAASENDEKERYRRLSEEKAQLDTQSDMVNARRKGKKEMEQEILYYINEGMSREDIIISFDDHFEDWKAKDLYWDNEVAALTFENTYLEKYKNILEETPPQKIQEIIDSTIGIAAFNKLYMDEIRDTLNDKTKQDKIMKEHKAQVAYNRMIINEKRKGKQEIMDLFINNKFPAECFPS